MYTCQLYQNEQREGRFQKLSGYLVLASKIFTGDNNSGNKAFFDCYIRIFFMDDVSFGPLTEQYFLQ